MGVYLFADDRALMSVTEGGLSPLFSLTEAETRGMHADSLILLGHSEDGPRLAAMGGGRCSGPGDS